VSPAAMWSTVPTVELDDHVGRTPTDWDGDRSDRPWARPEWPITVPDQRIHRILDIDAGPQLVLGYPEITGRPAGDEPAGDGIFTFASSLPPPPA